MRFWTNEGGKVFIPLSIDYSAPLENRNGVCFYVEFRGVGLGLVGCVL